MKKETLEDILHIGIFAPLFIPLIGLNNLFFPFITGKAFAFRILIEVLGGIWLLLAISDKRFRPRFSWILVAVLTFISVITAADIFGVNLHRSFWSGFERMDGLINLLHFLVYFLIAGTLLTTKKIWDRFLNTTIGVSVVLSLLGLAQLAGMMKINTDAGRLDSTIGNAAYFGVYLLLHIFLTIFMLVRWQGNPKGRYIYGAIALLHTIILYLTATRSAMLGLLGGIFVATVLIAVLERNNKILRKVAIATILGILILIGGFILVRNQPFIQQSPILSRFAAISLSGAKDQARYYLWSMAIEGFKERPILGWGQENFKLVFFKNYHPALYNDEIIFDRPHNVVLEWLIAGGVLGALSYLSLFGVSLYYLWFSKKDNWSIVEKSILTGFLAGYFINGLFLFDSLTSYLIFFGFLAYIHSQVLPEYEEEKIRNKLRKRVEQEQQNRIKNFAIPAAIVVLFGIYFFNAKGMMAAANAAPAVFFHASEPVKSLEQFRKALSYNSFGYEKLRQELAVVATNIGLTSNIDSRVKQEYLNLAKSEMEKQVEETPPDAHNFYLLGSLLYAHGKHAEAIIYLEKARELSPKKQVILLKLRDVYHVERQLEKAFAIAKEAYELEPQYPVARLAYAVSLMYTDVPISSPDFIDSLKLLEQQIIQVPNDNHIRLALASAYRKMGRLDKVLATIEKAIEADPSLKAEGEMWIRRVKEEMKLKR